MLKIRLQRVGKKKRPAYRFVVSESSRDLYGKHLEILGHYDPFSKVCEVNKDRILYWVSVGAQASPTAHNLLVDQNVLDKPKVTASKGKKKKGEAEAEKPAEAQPKAEGEAAPAETKPEEETPAAPEEKPEEAKAEIPAEETPVEEPKAEPAPAEEKK